MNQLSLPGLRWKSGRTAAWLVLGAGILLSVAAWFFTQTVVERDARARFQAATFAIAAEARQRVESYADMLYGLQGLFQAEPALSRAAFDRYIYSLNLPLRFPGAHAVAYAQRVPAAAKAEFERQLRRDPELIRRGAASVAIKPAGERAEYLPITYIEPLHANKAALGFDLAADLERADVIERARDSGMPALSTRVALAVDSTRSTHGVLMRLALYRKDVFTPDVERRRAAFSGMVNVTILVEELAQYILYGEASQKFNLSIHDVGLADTGPRPAPEQLYSNAASRPPQAGVILMDTRTIEVGQRRWELRFSAPREHFVRSADPVLPWAALSGVLLASLLLSGLIHSLAGSRQRARTLAAQITAELRENQAKLAEEQRRTQELIEVLPNPVYFKDTDGHYLGVNRAWERFFGVSRDTFIGKTVYDLYPGDPDLAKRLHADDQAVWDRSGSRSYETVITTSDGRRHDAVFYKAAFAHADGRVAGLIGTIVDITAQKQAEERIRHLAQYDDLTGLPNRRMFHDRLQHALAQVQRHARPLAILFIDLDRFKHINDTLGHEAGDRVLKEVAGRLRECLRDSDTVARLGGDEFVVLIEELPRRADVAAVAQKILDAVARPFILAGQESCIGASIGISTCPEDGKDAETLLKHADAAMYRAKEQGRNNYQFYQRGS